MEACEGWLFRMVYDMVCQEAGPMGNGVVNTEAWHGV
jgi:hypothetical protein